MKLKADCIPEELSTNFTPKPPHLNPENNGRNVGINPKNYAAQQPRRQNTESKINFYDDND
jgi:hypothetical protein